MLVTFQYKVAPNATHCVLAADSAIDTYPAESIASGVD